MPEGVARAQQPGGGQPLTGQERGVGHLAEEELERRRRAGSRAGRFSTRPSVAAKRRLVTGSGAAVFTGPASSSVKRAWWITPIASSIEIQLTH